MDVECSREKKAHVSVFRTGESGVCILEVTKFYEVGEEFEYQSSTLVELATDEAAMLAGLLLTAVKPKGRIP